MTGGTFERLRWPRPGALARRLLGGAGTPGRSARPAGDEASIGDTPECSVLDLGTGMVKALVVEPGRNETTVLSAAAAPFPGAALAGDHGGAASDTGAAGPNASCLAAAEQALVEAEDRAGVIPRRVIAGIPGRHCWVGLGQVEIRRPRPSLRISSDELLPALVRAHRRAATAAGRRYQAEHGRPAVLEPVAASVVAVTVDGRHVIDPAGLNGSRVQFAVAVASVPAAVARQTRRLVDALDLELASVAGTPLAEAQALAGGAHVPALIVDVGAGSTTVTVAGAHGAEGSLSFPVGGAALLAELVARLGLPEPAAGDAIVAHAAGAGERSSGGAATARAVRQIARHYTSVWLDALSVACLELARDRTLPPRLLLCGGAAGLPEIRHALAERSWQVTIPFERPPAIRLLTPADVPGVVDRATSLPALQAVPPLCLAAAAGKLLSAPAGADLLLREALASTTGRTERAP